MEREIESPEPSDERNRWSTPRLRLSRLLSQKIRAKYKPTTSQIRAKYELNCGKNATVGDTVGDGKKTVATTQLVNTDHSVCHLSTALERLPRVKVDKRDEVSRRVTETGGLRLGESLQQIHARKPDARTLEHEHKVVIRLAET